MMTSHNIDDASHDIAEGAGKKAAQPVTFSGTIGLFKAESENATPREAAVLILSPWGLEEMCTRKFFRILAEKMAAIGIPSLRFDYPGTGDALGDPLSGLTIEDWDAVVIAAADKLKRLSGRQNVILIGQGPGATIAQRLAERISGIAGIALLAPTLSGRGYLREIALLSKVVDQGLGLRESQRMTEGVSIAGFVMPEKIADAIRQTNLTVPERAGAPNYLILERPARMQDTDLRDRLQSLGTAVDFSVFEGYDDLVANPTIQKMPMQSAGKIIDWVATINPDNPMQHRSAPVEQAEPLRGEGFTETPLRFGDADHLFGILCVPDERTTATSTLILATAYDRNAGWGRSGTNTARALAKLGIASFRFDAANVGDSVPAPDAPQQVLYSETQKRDVKAALDLMETHLTGDLMIAGRCSGGYLALRSAAEDPRVKAVLSVNPFAFYWDPAVPFHSSLQFLPRSLDAYGQRMARLDTLRRLFAGQIDIPAAAKNVAIAIWLRFARRLAWLVRLLPGKRHIHREVKKTFNTYEQRNIPVSLIYSEGDVGLNDLHLHFGDQGKGIGGYRNVKLVMLPDTDHNITPASSKAVVFSEIVRLAKQGR